MGRSGYIGAKRRLAVRGGLIGQAIHRGREELFQRSAGVLENFFAHVGIEGVHRGGHGILQLTLGGGAEFEAQAVDQVTAFAFGGAGGQAGFEREVGIGVFVEHGVKRGTEMESGWRALFRKRIPYGRSEKRLMREKIFQPRCRGKITIARQPVVAKPV